MRPKPCFALVLSLIVFWLCLVTRAETAEMAREKILATFKHYEALNADFDYSVEKGHGKSGKSYEMLRKEVEVYGDFPGPFYDALDAAQTRVCRFKDAEILKEFFRVLLATLGSTDEGRMCVLGDMFLCQPDLVASTFRALPLAKQRDIYNILEWGFENIVYEKPKDDKNVLALRRKLRKMKPRVYMDVSPGPIKTWYFDGNESDPKELIPSFNIHPPSD